MLAGTKLSLRFELFLAGFKAAPGVVISTDAIVSFSCMTYSELLDSLSCTEFTIT